MKTTTDSGTKLKFVKAEGPYGNLARYEARVDHMFWGGFYVIDAVPSDVYEGRISAYTVQWHADGDPSFRGREIGTINTRFGMGVRYLTEAKKAAQADRDSWG